MSHGDPGFVVTMHFWVEAGDTGKTLVQPFVASYAVQPPVWCHDDPVVLEMQLDVLAKLKCLCVIRRNADHPQYAVLKDRSDYIVRAFMESYTYPPGSSGQLKAVFFPPERLRSA